MPTHITKNEFGYQVRIQRKGKTYAKTFQKKSEARKWRDQKLRELPEVERPEQWKHKTRTGVRGIGLTWKASGQEPTPYITAQWPAAGRWQHRARSVAHHGLEGALNQCLNILQAEGYLNVPAEEAKQVALPRLNALLEDGEQRIGIAHHQHVEA